MTSALHVPVVVRLRLLSNVFLVTNLPWRTADAEINCKYLQLTIQQLGNKQKNKQISAGEFAYGNSHLAYE